MRDVGVMWLRCWVEGAWCEEAVKDLAIACWGSAKNSKPTFVIVLPYSERESLLNISQQ